jgi:hypothetical protein
MTYRLGGGRSIHLSYGGQLTKPQFLNKWR